VNDPLGPKGRFQSEAEKEYQLSIINCPLGPKGRFQSEAEKELSIKKHPGHHGWDAFFE